MAILVVACHALLGARAQVRAQFTLTPAGVGMGFTLSTYATGFPQTGIPGESSVGPVGIGFDGFHGSTLVSDQFTGTHNPAGPISSNIYTLPDLDGQDVTLIPPASSVGGVTLAGIAQVLNVDTHTNNFFMAWQSTSQIVQYNFDGTVNHFLNLTFPAGDQPIGMIAYPVTAPFVPERAGHIFASTNGGHVFDINPFTPSGIPTIAPIAGIGVGDADGLAFTPDAKTLFVISRSLNQVNAYSYDATTGVATLSSTIQPEAQHGIDGIAVGTGALAGNIFVNANDGTLYEYGLGGGGLTMGIAIGTGGSRGDLLGPDLLRLGADGEPSSVLITQSDSLLRLTAPDGFARQDGVVPEPSSMFLLASGLTVALAASALRRRGRGRGQGLRAPALRRGG
jgi:hypothetical protein